MIYFFMGKYGDVTSIYLLSIKLTEIHMVALRNMTHALQSYLHLKLTIFYMTYKSNTKLVN
jgi:hypothetical protein